MFFFFLLNQEDKTINKNIRLTLTQLKHFSKELECKYFSIAPKYCFFYASVVALWSDKGCFLAHYACHSWSNQCLLRSQLYLPLSLKDCTQLAYNTGILGTTHRSYTHIQIHTHFCVALVHIFVTIWPANEILNTKY